MRTDARFMERARGEGVGGVHQGIIFLFFWFTQLTCLIHACNHAYVCLYICVSVLGRLYDIVHKTAHLFPDSELTDICQMLKPFSENIVHNKGSMPCSLSLRCMASLNRWALLRV